MMPVGDEMNGARCYVYPVSEWAAATAGFRENGAAVR